MSIRGYIKSLYVRPLIWMQRRRALQRVTGIGLGRDCWQQSLANPTAFYLDCYRYFHQKLPEELQAHRRYFKQERRGFGEDAFHVMWSSIFQECRPGAFLEIGVYRGQTISLASLLARRLGFSCEVCGISPFSPAGDSVSKYGERVDYYEDTLGNFRHFNLPEPRLLRAFSTDATAVDLIRSRSWDVIYIDGNHDISVVEKDWDCCSKAVRVGGLVVLDDSGLNTAYRPPVFATAGHPGPSQLARTISGTSFREVLQVGHNRVFERLA